jgi:hypothetical protein
MHWAKYEQLFEHFICVNNKLDSESKLKEIISKTKIKIETVNRRIFSKNSRFTHFKFM